MDPVLAYMTYLALSNFKHMDLKSTSLRQISKRNCRTSNRTSILPHQFPHYRQNTWILSAQDPEAKGSAEDSKIDVSVPLNEGDEPPVEFLMQNFANVIEIPILYSSMTSGGDILFPGCHQELFMNQINDRKALEYAIMGGDYENKDEDENEKEEKEARDKKSKTTRNPIGVIGVITLDAWGEACEIGTLAVVLDAELASDKLWCSLLGCVRFEVIEIVSTGEYPKATVAIFRDTSPDEVDEEEEKMQREQDEMMLSELMGMPKNNQEDQNGESKRDDDAGEQSFEQAQSVLVKTLKDTLRLMLKLKNFDMRSEKKIRLMLETVRSLESNELPIGIQDALAKLDGVLSHTEYMIGEIASFIALELVDISFMQRRDSMISTDTFGRMKFGNMVLEEALKKLVAKAALQDALSA